jgi:hypothetical protein
MRNRRKTSSQVGANVDGFPRWKNKQIPPRVQAVLQHTFIVDHFVACEERYGAFGSMSQVNSMMLQH